jgi:hypothetical protein
LRQIHNCLQQKSPTDVNGVYLQGLRIRGVLINFAELFQSHLKALAFSFLRVGWRRDVTMWEHFDVPRGKLGGDFTYKAVVRRNSVQVFIPLMPGLLSHL